jgi:ethanolamine-phosphate cytidylyltransferase
MAPTIDPEVGCVVPDPGDWPIDPQEDVEISDSRLWIDGCFDFFHHGHTGVMLQSRRLGTELLVGLHSDADIAANKGPTVMSLPERVAAVNACRFSTKCVPHAPYVTSLPWISHYGCRYVTHGDDITSDASGEDCYRFVKKAGRMKIVPRTPGISTTDLVGRMLNCTKEHFIGRLVERLREEGGEEMRRRIVEYAAGPSGTGEYVQVDVFGADEKFTQLVHGHAPRLGQRVVYVDGGFDLFSSGHIAFLETITRMEEDLGHQRNWYTDAAREERIQKHGEDYPPAYVIAGIHRDQVINEHKGINYPIMNIFERGLCVVQCRYIHAVVFEAPVEPTELYLRSLPAFQSASPSNGTNGTTAQQRLPDAVYHGPTSFMPTPSDPYIDAKRLGIFVQTPEHAFQDVNAAQIVQRILDKRVEYEERQRKKGMKSVGEGALRREEMEREAEAERLKRLGG